MSPPFQPAHAGARRPGERAQTLIEFALVFPIIVILLATIVDFGIALDRRITLQHGVREGARFAAVEDDTTLICQRTFAQAQVAFDVADSIEISYPTYPNVAAGDPVQVSAEFHYELFIFGPILTGLFGGVIDPDIVMEPSGTARLERGVSPPGAVVQCVPPP